MSVPLERDLDSAATRAREVLARALFNGYKNVFSPALHSFSLTRCKFLPTCSEYAYAAVVQHGWLHGSWLALRRIARCHPFAQGGVDPVPLPEVLEPKR